MLAIRNISLQIFLLFFLVKEFPVQSMLRKGRSKRHVSIPKVTDQELEKLSELLFKSDKNNAHKFIHLNLDNTENERFLKVLPQAFEIPTIEQVKSIHQYKSLVPSAAKVQAEYKLLEVFLETSVMQETIKFMYDKGFFSSKVYKPKDIMHNLWFNLFKKQNKNSKITTFEHVFMAEIDSNSNQFQGLHNWIYYHLEDEKNKIDYLGFTKKLDFGPYASIVDLRFQYDEKVKSFSSMFIGTSPELEMALYTVCFFARPDALCPVSFKGEKFKIKTNSYYYMRKKYIATSYPII